MKAVSQMHGVVSRPRIEAELQRYVQSAAMPCPYARLPTSYLHLDGDVDTEETRKRLKRALDEFWPDTGRSILAIVPPSQPSNHLEAREKAYWLRYQWHYLQIENEQSMNAEIAAKLRAHYMRLISDTVGFLGPRVMIGEVDIMMTAFNPLYDEEHPRYAPHTVFPVIRSKDLLAIHEKAPNLSFQIATHAKCKIILSMLGNRDGLDLAAMRKEFRKWLEILSYYQHFVTTIYTDSYRIDPRTLPHLRDNRRKTKECMESGRFQASLVAFRVVVDNDSDVPSLRRILAQNPDVTVFDIAKVVYGDVAGMYVPP
jgi:hypothetical protein